MSFLRSKRFALALMCASIGVAQAEAPADSAAPPAGVTLSAPALSAAPAESPANPAPPPAAPMPAPQPAAEVPPAKEAPAAPMPAPPAVATSPSRDVGVGEGTGVSDTSRRKIRDTVRKLDDLLSH